MPRENKEPIEKCNQCRFEILGMCRRNPPTSVWVGDELSSWYPAVRGMEDCFAGEPKEQTKPEKPVLVVVNCCENCKHWISKSSYYPEYSCFCNIHKVDTHCTNSCAEYVHMADLKHE